MSTIMSVPYSSSDAREDPVRMAIYNFVVNYSVINNIDFVEKLEWCSICGQIRDSSDFLEFLAWWSSRNEFRNHCFKNSYFGVIQQFRGLLTPQESDYVDERPAKWFGGISLRMFLRHVIERFPPRTA